MTEYSTETLHALIKDIKLDTAEIKEQVKKTNGRVNKLEVWRGFITGGLAIIGLIIIPIIFKMFF